MVEPAMLRALLFVPRPDKNLIRLMFAKRKIDEPAGATEGFAINGGMHVKYMLLVYLGENALNDVEREKCYRDSAQLARDLHSNGNYLDASPLHPTSTATSVRVRDGEPLVTDGPFAETREQLGGYYLIEAKNLDEAISIAARIPVARVGTIEIRPVMEIAGLPTG
jgi:hypothetical protein